MSILSKLQYRLNGFCIKISARLFMDRNNIILKFKWKYRDIKRVEPCLRQKNELKRLISPNINIYASTIIKTALYWQRINAQVSGTVNDMEMRSHKYASPHFFLTKLKKQFSGGKVNFPRLKYLHCKCPCQENSNKSQWKPHDILMILNIQSNLHKIFVPQDGTSKMRLGKELWALGFSCSWISIMKGVPLYQQYE